MHNILENYIDYFIDNNIELTREQVEILYEYGEYFGDKNDFKKVKKVTPREDRLYTKISSGDDLKSKVNDLINPKYKETTLEDRRQMQEDIQHKLGQKHPELSKDELIRLSKIEKNKKLKTGREIGIEKERNKNIAKAAGIATGVAAAAYGGKKLYDYYKKKKLEKEVQGK